jgi:hypothetical protein
MPTRTSKGVIGVEINSHITIIPGFGRESEARPQYEGKEWNPCAMHGIYTNSNISIPDPQLR